MWFACNDPTKDTYTSLIRTQLDRAFECLNPVHYYVHNIGNERCIKAKEKLMDAFCELRAETLDLEDKVNERIGK